MLAIGFIRSRAGLAAPVLTAAIVLAASVARRVVERRQRRATVRALEGLSDRTLKDIGIDRSEIASVARSTSVGRGTAAEDWLLGRLPR